MKYSRIFLKKVPRTISIKLFNLMRVVYFFKSINYFKYKSFDDIVIKEIFLRKFYATKKILQENKLQTSDIILSNIIEGNCKKLIEKLQKDTISAKENMSSKGSSPTSQICIDQNTAYVHKLL